MLFWIHMIFDFEGEIDGFAAQVGTGSFDPSKGCLMGFDHDEVQPC